MKKKRLIIVAAVCLIIVLGWAAASTYLNSTSFRAWLVSRINATITGLRFFFETTLDDPLVMRKMSTVRDPRKLPVILNPDEVRRLLEATTNRRALQIEYETLKTYLDGDPLAFTLPRVQEERLSAPPEETFQQELAFYRNALQLTGDPLIGLKLGEPFIPQRYGLFGYALLSARLMADMVSDVIVGTELLRQARGEGPEPEVEEEPVGDAGDRPVAREQQQRTQRTPHLHRDEQARSATHATDYGGEQLPLLSAPIAVGRAPSRAPGSPAA